MKKPNPHNEIISILNDLHKSFPSLHIGRHLATALDGYGDIWGLTNKEIAFALKKYKTETEISPPYSNEDELNNILKEGMHLENILEDEEEY